MSIIFFHIVILIMGSCVQWYGYTLFTDTSECAHPSTKIYGVFYISFPIVLYGVLVEQAIRIKVYSFIT